jgi:hypothetical protein
MCLVFVYSSVVYIYLSFSCVINAKAMITIVSAHVALRDLIAGGTRNLPRDVAQVERAPRDVIDWNGANIFIYNICRDPAR